MLHRLTAAALALTLAASLASCGGGGTSVTPPTAPAAQVPDDQDDGAQTLTSLTFRPTPVQVRALGLSPQVAAAPSAPISVTVAVKVGKAGTKAAGQKRAVLSWKFGGKAFPDALRGTTSGSYTVALHEGGVPVGKAKTGTVSVALPLSSGSMNTTRSRSTSYAVVGGGACAVATFALTLPDGSALDNGAAPVTVCEAGTKPPAPAPVPVTTLTSAYAVPWFGYVDRAAVVPQIVASGPRELYHFVGLYRVPVGAQVTATWRIRDEEDCGGRGTPREVASGAYEALTDLEEDTSPTFRVPVAVFVQDFTQGAGISWVATATLNGQTRTFEGLSCLSGTSQAM